MQSKGNNMKTSITSAQAMLHPTVVETINALSELCRELREELETARTDEREACAKFVDHILKEGGGTYGDAIRARGTT